jgi:hypothetical protein
VLYASRASHYNKFKHLVYKAWPKVWTFLGLLKFCE